MVAVANNLLSNNGNNQASGTMTSEDNSAIIPDAVLCEICCSEFYHDPSNGKFFSSFDHLFNVITASIRTV